MQGIGTHLILELWGCTNLNSPETVELALQAVVAATDVTLLDLRVYPFTPVGVTGVAIVAESHIMIHTWPEHGYAAIDIFTCGDRRDFSGAVDAVREHFSPERVQLMQIVRGILAS